MQQSEISMQNGNCAKKLWLQNTEDVTALSLLLMGVHSNDLHSEHEVVIFQGKTIRVGGIFLGW